jgi:hypothetical protein
MLFEKGSIEFDYEYHELILFARECSPQRTPVALGAMCFRTYYTLDYFQISSSEEEGEVCHA